MIYAQLSGFSRRSKDDNLSISEASDKPPANSEATKKATVVLVHGLTCAHDDWSMQVAALSPMYQCIAVDLRGHGKSTFLEEPRDMDTMAKDVIEVCTYQGVESAVFAGHSMGTRIIASVAEQAPKLVRGLVFVDGSRQALDNPEIAVSALKSQLIDDATTLLFAKKMFDQMFTDASDSILRNQIIQRAIDTPASVFKDLISQMWMWDSKRMEKAFSSIQAPVLAIQSTTINQQRERRCLEENETVPYLEFLQATISQTRTRIVTNTGHFTQLDAPDVVTSALRDMLEATDNQGDPTFNRINDKRS